MNTASDLLRSLDPDDIRRRLDEISRERQALMVLMRAARAKKTCRRLDAKRGDAS